MIYDFKNKLSFSRGKREETDIDTLQDIILGCVSIEKTDIEKDLLGIDYIVKLRNGAEIYIDAKAREKGCSKFWKNGQVELAPEIWSVRPYGKYNIPIENSKTGWTLKESSQVDYIYCTFDPNDTMECYLLPFQLYRIAFRKNLKFWEIDYRTAIQDSGSWESECIFVPAKIIMEAINNEMKIFNKNYIKSA